MPDSRTQKDLREGLSYDDEFYRDILDGLSRYLKNPFIADILETLSYSDVPELGSALNKNQMRCKKWLADELYATAGSQFGTLHVLGGWYGVLSAILLHDTRMQIGQAISYDLDPACQPVAESLNRSHVTSGKFEPRTADMHDLKFEGSRSDVIINTSCEHIEAFERWYAGLPAGMLLVLQSNDYYAIEEHINCVPDLEAFKQQAPMDELLFGGSLKLKKYTRFMLIGRK